MSTSVATEPVATANVKFIQVEPVLESVGSMTSALKSAAEKRSLNRYSQWAPPSTVLRMPPFGPLAAAYRMFGSLGYSARLLPKMERLGKASVSGTQVGPAGSVVR